MAYVELNANQLFASLVTNVDLDSILTLTMSSAFKCSPPFHPDPGVTQASATGFYLVSSPLAGDKRGVYTSWWVWWQFFRLFVAHPDLRSSAQRVSENISRGGATKYSTWEACLPAWHACCDAGEHAHPCLPIPATPVLQQPPVTPTMDRSLRRDSRSTTLGAAGRSQSPGIVSTPQRPRTPLTSPLAARTPAPVSSAGLHHLLPAVSSPGPRAHSEPLLPAGSSAPMRSYVVQGRGTIYTSLEAALVDFRAAGAAGPATLYTTDDAAIAWNVAMGRSPEEAIQLQLAEAIGGMVLDEAPEYDSENEYWRE